MTEATDWGSEVSYEQSVCGCEHTHTQARTHRHARTLLQHAICILVLIMPHTLKRTHSSGKCGGFSFHTASRASSNSGWGLDFTPASL